MSYTEKEDEPEMVPMINMEDFIMPMFLLSNTCFWSFKEHFSKTDGFNAGVSPLHAGVVFSDQPETMDFSESDPNPTENMNMLEPGNSVAMTTESVRDMDINRTLHQMAREGDIRAIRRKIASKTLTYSLKKLPCSEQRLKQERVYIQCFDNEQLTPLHYAARYGRLPVVLLLLKKGVIVNVRGKDDLTPLHMAARHCQLSSGTETTNTSISEDLEEPDNVISVLLRAGADVNAKDRYGMTPLHYSAMRGSHTATTELLQCPDINVKARDQQKMTALLTACTYGHVTICRLLIGAGASLSACDVQQRNCLHTAAKSGYPHVLHLLLDAADDSDCPDTKNNLISAEDEHCNTPLLLAVASGNLECVTILLQHGADINVIDDEENSPLHLAVTTGGAQIASLLLQKGASINLRNSYQQTPLHRAAYYNRCEIIPALLARGARLDQRDRNHCTALLLAAAGGHEQGVKLLLEKGADIACSDRLERNALHYCAERNHIGVLKVLLESNLMTELVDSVDIYGASPLHYASQLGHVQVLNCLLDAGADIDQRNEDEEGVLHVAAKFGKSAVVAEVLFHDPMSLNDQDEQQNTPLHLAALGGHVAVVRQLVTTGAAIVARNCHQWTPLDCAAVRGWSQTVAVLLESGSPVDTFDKSKTTPLQLAAREGHPKVAQKLLEAGAMVHARNNRGKNALEIAILHGNRDVAEIILRSSQWKDALRNIRYTGKVEFETPLRMLIRKYPDLAELALDNCISSNNLEMDDPNFCVVFDFEFSDDSFTRYIREDEAEIMQDVNGGGSEWNGSPFTSDGKVRPTAQPYSSNGFIRQKNHVLAAMVKFEREGLLNHPLCQKLIAVKWSYLTCYIYYFQLLVFSLFLTMFTGFMLTHQLRNNTMSSLSNSTRAECECVRYSMTTVMRLQIATLILASFLCSIEFFQLLRLIQLAILSGFEVMWTISGNKCLGNICICSTLAALTNYAACCHGPSDVNGPWKWQLAVAALFFGWMHLLLLIRQQPVFGIFVVMFTQVLTTFAKFALILGLFIAAFAICFHLLLSDKDQFASVSTSLLKTSVMVVGELDFNTIFHEGASVAQPLAYPLFIVFVVFMSILVMNLLVGLAVDDINSVREQANLKRLAMTVNLILEMEALLPVQFLRHAIRKHLTLRPNVSWTSSPTDWWRWNCVNQMKQSSSQQRKSLLEYMALREDVQKADEALEQRVISLSSEIKRMSLRLQHLSKQLTQLSTHIQNG